MIVTLSDYIMEQQVSTSSCDDIIFEQLQAEIEVGSALVSAYAKQLAMIEYASEYTMEADGTSTTNTTKKEGIFRKFWTGVKKVWKAICEWFGRRIESIKRLFGKGSTTDPYAVDTLISNLEKLPEEAKANFRCSNTMLAKIDSFKNYIEIMSAKLLPALNEYMEVASHFGYGADNYATNEKIKAVEKKIEDAKAEFDRVSANISSAYAAKKNTSAGSDMNYEETISALKDIKSKFSDNLKEKLDKMKEISKALSAKIDSLDGMPDINDDVNKANHEAAGKLNVASAYFRTSMEKVTKMITDVQKKVDADIVDIEKGLKGVQEKWIKYKKDNAAKNEAYEKAQASEKSGSIDRSRLGSGYKDMTDDQLRMAQAHGYDIYSNDVDD